MSRKPIIMGATGVLLVSLLPGPRAHAQSSIDRAISDNISRNIARGIDRALAEHIVRPTLQIRNSSGSVSDLHLSSAGSTLSLVLEDGTVRVWDIKLGIQHPRISPPERPLVAVGDHTGSMIAVGLGGGDVQLYRAVSRGLVKAARGHRGAVTALSFSRDGKWLASGGEDGFVNLWRADTLSREARLPLANTRVTAVAFSSLTGVLYGGDNHGHLRMWHISRSETTTSDLELNSPILDLHHSPARDELIVATARAVRIVDAATLAERKEIKATADVTTAVVDNGGRFIAYAGGAGEIRLLEIASGKITRTLEGADSRITSLALDSQLGRLVSASLAGKVRIWDIGLGEDLLRLVSTRRGWAVIDRQGRFDGSEQGLNDVIWNAREEELPLDRFTERFFEPGLLAGYIDPSAHELAAVPGAVSEGITLPPLVEIDGPEEQGPANEPTVLVVVATDRGGGIDTIRLYHNGKLVQPGSLLQQQTIETGKERLQAVAFRVLPIHGLNTFVAVANGRWGIEGRSSRLTMNFAGKASRPTLHVATLGLNRYKDARLSLNYGVPDARAILDSVGIGGVQQFAEVKRYALYNEEATRPNVVGLFEKLRQIRQDAILVLYLAGHGLVIDDDWHFLTHESRLQDEEKDYKPFSISAAEMQDWLVGANAQRILVLIDACYSGTGVQTFERFQHFQRRFIRRFSRAAGLTVLAASRKDQLAVELEQLGHGLFTSVVLDGLRGKADVAPDDGVVSAHELIRFSAAVIPELAGKYFNYRQTPMAFALGADFGLAAAKKTSTKSQPRDGDAP